MHFIVFDLEATCEDRNIDPYFDNEIIEIGAVKLNRKKEIVDKFDVFVKPKKNIILTDFCKNLTSITQEDVDNGLDFKTAIEQFRKFIGHRYVMCSWGFYDKNQLDKDSLRYGLDSTWVKDYHISLKHQHQKILNLKRAVGMEKALNMANLKLDGTHHRGIDDAENIAKIFIKYFDKWEY